MFPVIEIIKHNTLITHNQALFSQNQSIVLTKLLDQSTIELSQTANQRIEGVLGSQKTGKIRTFDRRFSPNARLDG